MKDSPTTQKGIDDVLDVLKGFVQQTDDRFNSLEYQINGINNAVVELKTEIIDLKKSHDRLLNTVDKFIGRIDTYETEQAARDNQFERLLTWARKVSKKTGIPLENL